MRNRTNEVNIVRGYYDEDIISYQIPKNFNLNIPPHLKIIEKVFGKYSAEMKIKENTIIYKRTLLLNEENIKQNNTRIWDFFQEIADADNLELEMKKM